MSDWTELLDEVVNTPHESDTGDHWEYTLFPKSVPSPALVGTIFPLTLRTLSERIYSPSLLNGHILDQKVEFNTQGWMVPLHFHSPHFTTYHRVPP